MLIRLILLLVLLGLNGCAIYPTVLTEPEMQQTGRFFERWDQLSDDFKMSLIEKLSNSPYQNDTVWSNRLIAENRDWFLSRKREDIDKRTKQGLINRVKAEEEYGEFVLRVFPNNQLMRELVSLRIMLVERVERGEISENEAKYLFDKRLTELDKEQRDTARSDTQLRLQAEQLRQSQRPVRCNSYTWGWSVDTVCR